MELDVTQLAVASLGVAIGAVGAFFAWRVWDRGRGLIVWEFDAELRPRDVRGETGYALALGVMLRCKRGSVYVRRITLGRDKKRQASTLAPHLGDLDSGRLLEVGDAAWVTAFPEAIAELNDGPNGPVRVACYLDAAGKRHCHRVDRVKLEQVLAAAVQPEADEEDTS